MSNVIYVSSAAELTTALASAQGGETVLLRSGWYGDLSLTSKTEFNISFPSNVTIASADPSNPAIFSGLDVRDAANLTFDGVTFDYQFQQGDPLFFSPFSISSSENITIRNSTFDGDLAEGVSNAADGFGTGVGLAIRGSTSIAIENNEFFDFHRGLKFLESSNITLRANDIHSIRSDGMNFAEVSGVLIEGNYIHDFRASVNSLDHRDMIQFWTNGTDMPSSDITIRGNHLDIGNGDYTQSIFMRNDLVDRGLAGPEMFYRDIVIEENVIINGHSHGITVGETDGLVIRNNSVLHADGSTPDGRDPSVEIPNILVSEHSKNVVIANNATSAIIGTTGQADWNVQNNAFVQDQDPSSPGFYGDVFLSSSLKAENGLHHFLALPGSMLDMLSAGATATHDYSDPSFLTAQIHVSDAEESGAMRYFDAGFSTSSLGELPEGTVFQWDFGDGSAASGKQVSHSFGSGGSYDVRLTVKLPDGTIDTRNLSVNVSGPNLVSYSADTGLSIFENGEAKILEWISSEDAAGVKLGDRGVGASISREHVADILNQDEFSISMTLTAATETSAGEVMRLHGSFVVSVNPQGEISLLTVSKDGSSTTLVTSGAQLSDMQAHNVDLSLKDGALIISVDGNILAETTVSGPFNSSGTQDLVFGNPWGKANFAGSLSKLDITVNESDFGKPPVEGSSELFQPLPGTAVEEAVIQSSTPETSDVHTSGSTEPEISGEVGLQGSEDFYTGGPLDLGGKGVTSRIGRDLVSDILGQDAFSISLTLTADSIGSTGEVFRLHQSFVTSVNEQGEFYLQAFTENGERIRLTTQGANLADTNAHDVKISLNNGMLDIAVDGSTLASSPMSSPLANKGSQDLTFGNPWGKENFDGKISTFMSLVEESSIGLPLEPEGTSQLLSYMATTGLSVYENGEMTRLNGDTFSSSTGIDLGGPGVTSRVDRGYVEGILGQDAFSMSMTLTADSAGSTGEIARLHQSFVASVNKGGELYLQAFTEEGERIRLTTSGANLADTTAHDITISLKDGVLGVSVDGDMLASTVMSSPLADKGAQDLTFGNPWGKENFDGTLSAFDISLPEAFFEPALTKLAPLIAEGSYVGSFNYEEAALLLDGREPEIDRFETQVALPEPYFG